MPDKCSEDFNGECWSLGSCSKQYKHQRCCRLCNEFIDCKETCSLAENIYKPKCYECGILMIYNIEDEEWEGWGNPKIIVPQVKGWKCPNCGDKLYDNDEAQRIENAMRRVGEWSGK